MHDVKALDKLTIELGSFYIMDRTYIDFRRLYIVQKGLVYFIIRAKKSLDYNRQSSRPADKSTSLRCDQTIKLRD